jgi:hypothetical protein
MRRILFEDRDSRLRQGRMSKDLPHFEKAEYPEDAGLVTDRCTRCRQMLTEQFYLLNGHPLCELCANAAVMAPAEGGDAAFLQAMLFGLGGAILGSVLYAGIEIATGWTIGYVALAVGWLVGKAMKQGSAGRGGRRYQVVAAILTYCSVSFGNLAVILHGLSGREIVINERFVIRVAEFVLLSPFVELRTRLWSGIIGIFILTIGLRAAWAMTAGSEYQISGPHTAANTGTPL